ncbi:MAG: Ferric iron ABC transporter, permease protein, partial [uncultured Thermomicrobiales bacterium]
PSRGGGFGRLVATLLTVPVALPLLYLVLLALQAGPARLWTGLVRADAAPLSARVALLAAGATLWALALGAPWAWLVARTDVPGRRFFRWLGPLPLAIPPYVGALAYVFLLAPRQLLHRALAAASGRSVYDTPFPDLIYGPWGAAFVLGTFTAPYVFLNVHGALGRLDPGLEDAARGLGHGPRAVFRRVTLPLLRPALTAGALLVFGYAWVDFGVVSLLRVRTFTTVVYTYLLAGLDLGAAAGLSLVLVLIVWATLGLQGRALGRARYTQRDGRAGAAAIVPLGRWRPLALLYLGLVVGLTLVLPLGVLAYQAAAIGSPAALGAFLLDQAPHLWNSLRAAAAGSALCLLLAAPVAWQGWRGRGGAVAGAFLQAGYAIPGTVLGLSLIGLALALVPALYERPIPLLAGAYAVLFAAPALQGVRAALAQVPPSMEEAVRALGRGPLVAAVRVVVPLAWPGIASTWLLGFILALRELAATIVLRPAGFDTLPVRIWTYSTEVGLDPRAAALALLLVALVGVPWLLLTVRRPGATGL